MCNSSNISYLFLTFYSNSRYYRVGMVLLPFGASQFGTSQVDLHYHFTSVQKINLEANLSFSISSPSKLDPSCCEYSYSMCARFLLD